MRCGSGLSTNYPPGPGVRGREGASRGSNVNTPWDSECLFCRRTSGLQHVHPPRHMQLYVNPGVGVSAYAWTRPTLRMTCKFTTLPLSSSLSAHLYIGAARRAYNPGALVQSLPLLLTIPSTHKSSTCIACCDDLHAHVSTVCPAALPARTCLNDFLMHS